MQREMIDYACRELQPMIVISLRNNNKRLAPFGLRYRLERRAVGACRAAIASGQERRETTHDGHASDGRCRAVSSEDRMPLEALAERVPAVADRVRVFRGMAGQQCAAQHSSRSVSSLSRHRARESLAFDGDHRKSELSLIHI